MQDLNVGNGAIVAVGEARTVLPTPNLSAVKSVDTQTRAIGLIHPPPDIRAIVDKTADFVGRNGENCSASCSEILQALVVSSL